MATLVSPGVSVTVIDESISAGRGAGTVPFVMIATAEGKSTPDGAAIAEGTLQENAGKVYAISSQRELLQTFGEAGFQSVGGTAIHGSPLSEYGVLATHSYLGLANRAYVVRADLDLAELESSTIEPTSPVPTGTYWFDTDDSEYGLHVLKADPADPSNEWIWSPADISFVFVGPRDNAQGNDGDYAVEYITVAEITTISYLLKAGGSWAELFVPENGATPAKLVSSDVYPLNDVRGVSFTVTDVDFAYWVKTSTGNNGADYVIRLIDSNGQFNQVTVPVHNIEYETTGTLDPVATAITDADAFADAFYGGTPSSGDLYVRAYFKDEAVLDDLTGDSFIRVIKYDGAVWAETDEFTASASQPTLGPVDGTYWYNADIGLDAAGKSTTDILVNNGTGAWENIQLTAFTHVGDISTEQFFQQSLDPELAGETLVNGDIWLDTADLANYPALYRWKGTKWFAIDKTDQTTPSGILFADARPDPEHDVAGFTGLNNGGVSGPDLDADVPDPDAYPAGMLLWNTRFSSRGVRVFTDDVFVYTDANTNPVLESRWVNASGNDLDGSPKMGIDAQRSVVVEKLNEQLVSNDELRSEAIKFNLIATPGFPECIDEMLTLNIDRKETGFVLGDTPFTLTSNTTDLQNWATNANNASGNGQDGLVSADPYLGVYYPSGLSTNTDGAEVVVPPSHMMLRTIGFNDQVAYPWFAPAGLQRGRINNASSVGYLDAENEFVSVALNQGQRDTLYLNNINPIAFITGQGLIAYGQKTRNPFESALDRVNVARLINYMRDQAEEIARPYLFEPNDKTTRDSVLNTFNGFMSELVTLRGVFDFLVVCDESNNTPARIDRNELWIDIAVQPAKSIEFIFIPIRIKNTGEELS